MGLFNSVLKNETRPKGYIQIKSKFEVSVGVCFIPSSFQVRASQCCWRVQLLLSFYLLYLPFLWYGKHACTQTCIQGNLVIIDMDKTEIRNIYVLVFDKHGISSYECVKL